MFDELNSLWGRKREIARHVVEIPLLFFHRKSELLEISLDMCENPLGFSYGKNGWHPVIPLIKEMGLSIYPNGKTNIGLGCLLRRS